MSGRFNRITHHASDLIPVFVFVVFSILLLSPSIMVKAARYDSGQMDFVVGVDGNITIMLPKNNISFMVDASKNEVASSVIDIGIASNLTHGVKIGMTTAYSNVSDDDITGNGLNSVHSYTIPTLDTTVHKSLFPTNHWGYSVDGGVYYNHMPAANEGVMGEIVIDDPSAVNVQQVYIGAKADISQPLDYYYTTINFTAITNFAAKTIDDIIYMQEMTPEVVESMETNRQYRLRDSRDKKDYWIAKFDDGNVWMTQNLDLDLSPSLILTPEDTDIKRVWASENTKPEIDYDRNDSYAIISKQMTFYHNLTYSNGVYSYQNSRYEYMYGTDIDDCLNRYQDNPKFCNHFRKGQSYSWLDAVAAESIQNFVDNESHGIIVVDESICPKGWRLPIAFSNSGSTLGDFPSTTSTNVKEYDEHGLVKMSGSLDSHLMRAPFFFTDNGYWTSSLNSSNSPLYKAASNSGINLYTASQGTIYKIRCKARPTNTFKLEFSLNGGTGTVPEPKQGDSWNNYYTFNLDQLPSAGYPKKEGYNLIGWSTNPNATHPDAISYGMDNNGGIYNQDGKRVVSSYTATSPVTKLYAVWEDSIKVQFNANGGQFNSASLYDGETPETITIAYSIPLSGMTESETRTFSSKDCNGLPKTGVDDTKGYCQGNSDSFTWNFAYDYDYVDVTVYYAVSGNSTLCVNGYSGSYCNGDTSSGNLAQGAYYNASSQYLYKKDFRFTNGVMGIYFYGGNSTDGLNNWYGVWAEAKGYKKNTNIQYIRSTRRSPVAPSREGYRFIGWSTNPNATFANWEYSSSVKHNSDLQLYAVWVECPTVTVNFVTESDHVQINTPSITWDTTKTISINKNSRGVWNYYDSAVGDYVDIATVTASSDRFYLVSSSISHNTLSSAAAQNLNEGDTLTVTIYYTEEPIDYMQDLTRESCAVAPLNTAQQLGDKRDEKKYWVTKLADGNCWMTQNLDLEIRTQANGGTVLQPSTSNVTAQQTVYAATSWSTAEDSNSYFDGGDYYYADGVTPTSTSGLAPDSELWHYHKGSYYNKKLSKLVCPSGWQLGSYRDLFNEYGISQPKALVFSTVGTSPLQAPFYHIVDYNTPSNLKPSESNNQQYTLYWTSSYFVRDIVTTLSPSNNYADKYFTPLVFYSTSTDMSKLSAMTNPDRTYRYNESVVYRTAGFVRCVR